MNLIGHKYGRLTVVSRGTAKSSWVCRCDCGGDKTALASNLRSGRTQSCGCLWREAATRHGASGTPTYSSWRSMVSRCTNPADPSFDRYGGAGVTVSNAWLDFASFRRDMGDRPSGKSIDRYPNPAGNYEPGNCRWATGSEQQRNKREAPPLIDTPHGRMRVCEASEIAGISANVLRARLRLKWPAARLFDPIDKRSSHPKEHA